jgi:hypothetical protein
MTSPSDDDLTVFSGSIAGVPALDTTGTGTHALPVGTRLGEFEIMTVLGEGGFGVVYLAHDNSLERQVALKEYMPSFARRGAGVQVTVQSAQNAESFEAGRRSFVNEARLLAKFDHPSLVKVYRFWEANGTAYMVMPYYRGPTLKQMLLARTERPDEVWLTALLAPLLDALESIHQDHCYHRDIAPDNILMLEEGRPLLLDFGAARRAVGEANQAFTVILKQNYAPIEQYAEMPGMSQGAWTDLYALASVIHFAIDGTAPPPAMSRMMADPYVPLATRHAGAYSPAFLGAIDAALAFKPADRPQDVNAMRALLGIPAQPQPAPVRAPASTPAAAPVSTPPAARAAAPGLRFALLGVGAIALAGAGVFAFLDHTPDAPASGSGGAPAAIVPDTAAAATAETPAPATAIPFDPIAALGAVQAGADPQRAVTVDMKCGRARIGIDQLCFSVRSSHAGYVYVHMVSTDRKDFLMMYPNRLASDNRIGAGETITLPGPGWPIDFNGPAGTDHFVVMVSETPRDFKAAGLVEGVEFATFPMASAARLQATHTGPAPLFAGTPVCTTSQCVGRYGAASFEIEEVAP